MEIEYKTTVTVTATISQQEFYNLDLRAIRAECSLFEWLADNFASLCESIEFDQSKMQIIAECCPTKAISLACALKIAAK